MGDMHVETQAEMLAETQVDMRVENKAETHVETHTRTQVEQIDTSVNKLLGGRYRLVKIIGRGGTSVVYLAENVNLGTFWAVKRIQKNTGMAKVLKAEPDILKKLNHPALPRIIDIIEDNENIYIIQDYIEGNSLYKELKKVKKFPEKQVMEWAKQICDVLAYLHSFKPNPIIYRDMKPSNIILTPWGDIKLVDFGIAREYKEEAKNDTVYIGTRGYAAPEQYGGGQSNITTDIYSLGVTLYNLLTGKGPDKYPFGLDFPGNFEKDISHGMMQVICKCTRYNPQERYQSVQELKKDIEAIEKKAGSGDHDNIPGEKAETIFTSAGRLVLTIWGNTEFACELAYIASKLTRLDVLLVDLDLLSPKADLFLDIKKYPEKLAGEGVLNESGINIVLDSMEKGLFTRESLLGSCIKCKELDNLYILTGNYRLENYEYYTDESLAAFIDKARMMFDVLILAVSKWIYDLFTVISLIKSDLNIVPVRADIDHLREFNNYIAFLKEKQQLRPDKAKFVAFDYCKSINLEEDAIEEITRHNYLGKIRYCQKRAKCRNLRLSYAREMDMGVVNDYILVLKRLKLLSRAYSMKAGSKKVPWRFLVRTRPAREVKACQ
ncbi:MAG: protein kinase [Clostridiaceae bacterium]|nr:protein kinase [Clostridiaceae bacterium]